MNLVKAKLLGAVAGVAGTAAMDLLWYRRYRAGGGHEPLGQWETAADTHSYDQAGAPARVGRKAYKALTGKDPAPDTARLMTNAVHWTTGVQWAAVYGIAAPHLPQPWAAVAFGPFVWGTSYVILPAIGVYKPIWKYDAKTLWSDLSAHLVYGAVTTGTYAALRRRA